MDRPLCLWALHLCLRHHPRDARGCLDTSRVIEAIDVLDDWHQRQPSADMLLGEIATYFPGLRMPGESSLRGCVSRCRCGPNPVSWWSGAEPMSLSHIAARMWSGWRLWSLRRACWTWTARQTCRDSAAPIPMAAWSGRLGCRPSCPCQRLRQLLLIPRGLPGHWGGRGGKRNRTSHPKRGRCSYLYFRVGVMAEVNKDKRNKAIRAIQAARRKHDGLSEDICWRGYLDKITGKSHLTDMDYRDFMRVLDALNGKEKPKADFPYSDSPQMRKIRVLWGCLRRADKLKNPTDQGLAAFIRRTTRQDMGLLATAKASDVIQALISWCEREGVELGDSHDR